MLPEIPFAVHPNLTPRVHDAKRPRTRGVGFRWTVNEISASILGRNSTQTNTKPFLNKKNNIFNKKELSN